MTTCKGCGGEIALTVYGYGHLTNPGYKHHVPTPRSGRASSSSRAQTGVPEQVNTDHAKGNAGTPPRSTPASRVERPVPPPDGRSPARSG